MILGILCGIGINFSVGFANIAEIIYIGYGIYAIIKQKKIKFSRELNTFIVCMLLFILYTLLYFFFDKCDNSKIIKNMFKYVNIMVLTIISFQFCKIDMKKFLRFLIAFFTTEIIYSIFNNPLYDDLAHILHYTQFLLDIYIIMLLFEDKPKIKLILYVVAILLALYSRSRTSLMIILMTIIYNIYQILLKQNLDKNKLIRKVIMLISLMVVGIIGINYFSNNLSKETESNEERKLLLRTAMMEIKQNPLTGVGPGNFNLYAKLELNTRFKSADLTVHNYYLEILTEWGVIGFTIFFFYYIKIIKVLIKRVPNMMYKKIYIYFFVFSLFNTSSGEQRIKIAILLSIIFYDLSKEYKEVCKNE